MTVYELIQELTQFEPNQNIKLNIKSDEYNCEDLDGNDVTVKFNENFFEIDRIEREFGYYKQKNNDVIMYIKY